MKKLRIKNKSAAKRAGSLYFFRFNRINKYNKYSKLDTIVILIMLGALLLFAIFAILVSNKNNTTYITLDSKFSDITYLTQNKVDEDVDENDPGVPFDNSIIIWGDDFATNAKSTTTYYGIEMANVLANNELSSSAIYFAGTIGDSIDTILAKQGIQPMKLAPVTIPATTTPTKVSITDYLGRPVATTDIEKGAVNPCVINGIEGNLTQKNSDIYFTRSEKGEASTISNYTDVNTFAQNHLDNYTGVIFIGTLSNSDLQDVEILVSKYRKLADSIKTGKYVIISNINGTKATNKQFDIAMQQEFGDDYLNLRDYLTLQVFDDFNIQPTSSDISQILNGEVPSLFLTNSRDSFSHIGNEVMSELLLNELIARGYLS